MARKFRDIREVVRMCVMSCLLEVSVFTGICMIGCKAMIHTVGYVACLLTLLADLITRVYVLPDSEESPNSHRVSGMIKNILMFGMPVVMGYQFSLLEACIALAYGVIIVLDGRLKAPADYRLYLYSISFVLLGVLFSV